NKILCIGAPASRLEVAKEWGADEVLNIEDMTDVRQRIQWVRDRTGSRGADVVVQCASGAAIPEAMEMTRQGGRCLSIGVGGGGGALTPGTFGSKTYIG